MKITKIFLGKKGNHAPKLEKLLETHNLVNNYLSMIHKELERKAKAILDQRKTKKTTADSLSRMLEGLHAHLKTTSISISKEAGILQKLNLDRITYLEY